MPVLNDFLARKRFYFKLKNHDLKKKNRYICDYLDFNTSTKTRIPTEEILREHYAELADKPFFPDLLSYVGSGPVVCMAWRGREAVKGG